MKLIQLKYFCGVVENGGFIAASRDLNVAQPALSRQISELESEIGCQLFFRGPGGTKTTESGQKFYLHARKILSAVALAQADMQISPNQLSGEVTIALPVGMASQLAPLIVRGVERMHPAISVKIEDGLGYQAGQAIDAGKVDFGIIANVGRLHNVTYDPILEESLFFFTKRFEADPDTTNIDLAAIQDIDLIMPDRKVNVRRGLENAMIKIGGKLNVRYEQQSLLTIRSMVRAGIGATVMNWPSLSDLWYSGELDARIIVNPGLSRAVCLAVPNARPLSSSAAATYDIVKRVMETEIENGNWRGGQIVENQDEFLNDGALITTTD